MRAPPAGKVSWFPSRRPVSTAARMRSGGINGSMPNASRRTPPLTRRFSDGSTRPRNSRTRKSISTGSYGARRTRRSASPSRRNRSRPMPRRRKPGRRRSIPGSATGSTYPLKATFAGSLRRHGPPATSRPLSRWPAGNAGWV
jgi:hypothetical protein